MRKFLALLLISFVTAAGAGLLFASDGTSPILEDEPTLLEDEPTLKVVLTSEVEWEQLNPARGANSPLAATLWGDRTGPGPSGFLLKPVDGFKSPPHIHTADYHGVVINGAIHNADPDAEKVYLPAGSFWTQPGGGVHITAAKGSALAYIEVQDTFDVLPAEKATDKEDEAVVIQASNITWVDQPGMRVSPEGPKVAPLWSDPKDGQPCGTLVKLQSGFAGITMSGHGSSLHAVVIQGQPIHGVPGDTDYKTLEPGSYFGSEGESFHQLSCVEAEDCIIYVRNEFKFDVVPESHKK